MISRLLFVLLLVLPFYLLPGRGVSSPVVEPSAQQLQSWNPESLQWSTVLIWSERSSSLTAGVLIDRQRRRVLAARHALENVHPDGSPAGLMKTFYVIWPSPDPQGNVITESNHYFQMMRNKQVTPAKLLADDASRDLVLLEAGDPPPSQALAVTLHHQKALPETTILGMAQPFTRAALWFPFKANLKEAVVRKLTYSPLNTPVALYLAQAQEFVEFGYSGSPLVLPHNGELVGILLAAQVNQPLSFALISSQEIHRFLADK